MHAPAPVAAATATQLARPMLPDIDQRLATILQDWARRPFAWGQADCCQFVADAANRLYGLRLSYGPYSTEFGAARLLARLGQLPVALQHAGFVQVPNVREAQRGDVVMWRHEAVPAPVPPAPGAAPAPASLDALQGLFSQGLGLCIGAHVVAKSAQGLLPIAPPQWRSAWRFVGLATQPAPSPACSTAC